MWIRLEISGSGASDSLPDGRRVQRPCERCNEPRVFVEQRSTPAMKLFLIPALDHRTRHVMRCDTCGALYATDEAHESPARTTERADAPRTPAVAAAASAASSLVALASGLRAKLDDAARALRTPPSSGARSTPSRAERAERLRLAAELPGGAPTRPLRVATSHLVEAEATRLPCVVCGSDGVRCELHEVEWHGDVSLRVARLRCRDCDVRRNVYFEIALRS